MLEYPIVFITHCSEGNIPHVMSSSPEELAEERNMYYVAQTRAQHVLYMMHTKTRQDYKGIKVYSPSPFTMDNLPVINKLQKQGAGLVHVIDTKGVRLDEI